MPSAKQPAPAAAHAPAEQSMLSFVPSGMPRSIAEYLVALIPCAVLLFAFFVAAESAVALLKSDLLAIAFAPVICLLPILSGVVSTLVLEKLRSKPLTMQRGAMVGGAAALAGSAVSSLMLLALDIAAKIHPFGSSVTGILLFAALAVVVVMDGVLGALGGALAVKFIKDV